MAHCEDAMRLKLKLKWAAYGGLAVSYGYCLWHTITGHVMSVIMCYGESMIPTINRNPPFQDLVVVEFWSKRWNRLKTGDVVVAWDPWKPGELICKRITAVEGDTIPPGSEHTHSCGVIPRGHIWLEGDNTHASYDSRNHGAIPLALVYGRVWYKILPFSERGRIK